MRAVVSADLHVHPWREASSDGGQDRLQDGLNALRQMLAYAHERKAPFVFLGDLKHLRDRWLLSVLHGVWGVFDEFPAVRKVLLPGNHDGLADGTSGLHVFAERDDVVLLEQPDVGEVEGLGLVAHWPWWPSSEALPGLLAGARKAKAKVLLAHAFLSGAVVGPDGVDLKRGATLEQFGLAGKNRVFDVAFFGDVHVAQMLGGRQDQAFIWYPGSPLSTNWGERGECGCLYVEID